MAAYTIANLPYGVITTKDHSCKRCAVAFEDFAIDIAQLHQDGFFKNIPDLSSDIFAAGNWNAFASLPPDVRRAFRTRLRSGIETGDVRRAFLPFSEVKNHLPMRTENFSDFYCSLEHHKNCSEIFNLPIKPSWYVIPSVYNGRTSSLVVSGTDFHRPYGVYAGFGKYEGATLAPESHMDFEVEMGVWLSKPVPRNQRLNIDGAKDHIFGLTLLNDWSARQIQGYEMAPLGPFHSKGTATTVSSWIVPIEALEASSCATKTKQEPAPPPHLTWPEDNTATFDIDITLQLLRDGKSYMICETNLNELHWTPFQQITHLASAGESVLVGDVFGTGTISSPRRNGNGEKTGIGCLMERSLPSARLSSLPSDLIDTFLKDGDEILMQAWARDKHTGEVILGFGDCRGKVLPAIDP
ncbi:fumarylacetoacetase [Exophiala spinifera]|uniref:Fumarylacetoacetase n=1 Tax=Exophiala spinifera TaxID=91928 RepID=A0A0D2B8Y7_9EURO|nr:fumarylacetoacetase [Exophiala spinifera]KIW15120.1 fumarylacetoacetase [Exophiala spinifera]